MHIVRYGRCATLLVGLLGIAFLVFAYAFLQPVVVAECAVSFLLAVNLVTFIYFCYDKAIAGRPGYRVPEYVLHWLSFFGGWPAALVAQEFLRHKTRKRSFRRRYFAILLVHVVVVGICWYKWYHIRTYLPLWMEVPMPFAKYLQGP